MYICSLSGKDVFQNCTNICVIDDISKLDKVRDYIKEHFNIEFEETLNVKYSSFEYRIYENKTDERDVRLVIENIPEL